LNGLQELALPHNTAIQGATACDCNGNWSLMAGNRRQLSAHHETALQKVLNKIVGYVDIEAITKEYAGLILVSCQ
jgi:hypothetical protein